MLLFFLLLTPFSYKNHQTKGSTTPAELKFAYDSFCLLNTISKLSEKSYKWVKKKSINKIVHTLVGNKKSEIKKYIKIITMNKSKSFFPKHKDVINDHLEKHDPSVTIFQESNL